MKIFVFGNMDIEADSLPVKLLPVLQKIHPEYEFVFQDPNEEWDTSKPFWVIDTVMGLPKPTLFTSLDAFTAVPRVSMHDFDALTNLRFLKKLGKLPKIKIIGLPPMISKDEALESISCFLNSTHPNQF